MNDLLEPTNYSTPISVNSIVYNTLSTEDGWRIETRFPHSVPSSDKVMVLKSLEEYRREILKAYPLWYTTFTVGDDFYCLEIKRTNNARELLNSLQKKATTTWGTDQTYGR